MTMAMKTGDRLTKRMRWSARVVGITASCLLVLFVIESGARILPALSWSSPTEMPLLLALALAVMGVLIAWRWETVGGAMTVAGAVAIIALAYMGSGPAMVFAALMLTLPLFVAGALYLACHWRTLRLTAPR